jgi:hypothetical protein
MLFDLVLDPAVVADKLGHADTTFTIRRYIGIRGNPDTAPCPSPTSGSRSPGQPELPNRFGCPEDVPACRWRRRSSCVTKRRIRNPSGCCSLAS